MNCVKGWQTLTLHLTLTLILGQGSRSPICARNSTLQLVPTKGVREWGTSRGKMKKQCLCLALAKRSLALWQIKAKIWTWRKKCCYYSVAEALVRNGQLFIRRHTLYLYSTSQYLNHISISISISISSHLIPTTSCRPGWGQANQYCYLTETQWGSK